MLERLTRQERVARVETLAGLELLERLERLDRERGGLRSWTGERLELRERLARVDREESAHCQAPSCSQRSGAYGSAPPTPDTRRLLWSLEHPSF